MRADIFNRYFRSNHNFDVIKSLFFKIPKASLPQQKIKSYFFSPISSIKKSFEDLFFDFFPNNQIAEENQNILPPRVFFGSDEKIIPYLLKESVELAQEEYSPYLEYLKNLSFFGTLKQKKDKSVYLDFDAQYIDLIFSSFIDKKIKKPEQKILIEAISKKEMEIHEVGKIRELKEKFQFRIKGLYSIKPELNHSLERIWFLEIESKDLEEFRYKHHLSPKKGGHNLYITIGIKHCFKLRKSFPKMKINFSFSAA